MPTSLYTENSEKWKSLASIDYFTQFVKAWIPLNAWYKNYYPDLRTDRAAINEIKFHPNKIRNRLISLLNDSSNDGSAFRSRIAELHFELERKYVFNKGERISFEKVVIEDNPNKQNNFSYKALTYKVERDIAGRPQKEIQINIIKNDGSAKFTYTQTNGFNVAELMDRQEFLRLTQTQQNSLKVCYEAINPRKPINLLSHNPSDCITMGSFSFISDSDALCKGVIEILYKLRNALFHGEIIPDSDTNKVYEPAYQILYTLIQAL